MNTLSQLDLAGKTVLYHPDYSVPMKDGKIADDYRIVVTYPTLDYLIKQNCKIVIVSKMGDPKGQYVAELELRPVAEVIADHYPDHVLRLAHEIDAPEVTAAIAEMQPGDMLMLPNIRFYPEEQTGDVEFGKRLAALADVFVADEFPVIHRADASNVIPPTILPSAAGIQLEKELSTLGGLLKSPAQPFVVIMGGAKVSDKIEVMRKLAAVADTILIGGAMANTFLLAKGEDIGDSLAEHDKVEVAKSLMEEFGDKLVLATDFAKDDEKAAKFRYLDIGSKSIDLFKEHLKDAKTIFWNGSLGYTEDPKYAVASTEIAKFISARKDVVSVVAGGDTVELVTRLKMRDDFTFVSSGGGAALDLLAGVELPGVIALG